MTEPALANRQQLAAYFAASGFTIGAEIGVGDGVYAQTLLAQHEALTLTLVDPWDDAGGNRRDEASYQRARTVLAPFAHRVVWLRLTSLEARRLVPDRALDFAFIDAAHDELSVTDDLLGWTPKVRAGGIVAGHDYYAIKQRPSSDVMRAVDAYVALNGLTLQVIPWDRGNPERDSRQPCWWFRVPGR